MFRSRFRVCLLPQVLVLIALALGTDEPKGNSVPRGEVIHFIFDKSKVFPGTVRDCWVYVPQQGAEGALTL